MKRGYLLVLSAMVANAGVWAVGCGSTTSTPSGDGGNETGDAEPDSTLADATPSDASDGGQVSPSDSATDAPQDVAQDAPQDAPIDAPQDVALDAPQDAPIDAPQDAPDAAASLTIDTFPAQLAQTLCARQANCCFPSDPSSFDTNRCVQSRQAFGYANSNLGTASTDLLGPGLLDGGNVSFNATAAQACLADIEAINCSTNVITTAESVAIYRDCYGAYQGTLAVGSACGGSIECAAGEFCGVADGGSGDSGVARACQTLEGTGGPCGQFATAYNDPTEIGPTLGETACSYRASGNTGNFCFFASLTTGGPIAGGPAAWVCSASNAVGTGCNNDIECQTKLCDPGSSDTFYQCVSSMTFLYPNYCAALQIKDAGSGGG
jgi:hypothetical protein